MRVLIVSYGVVPDPSRHGVGFDNLLKALASRFEVDALTLRAAEQPYVQNYRRSRMLRVPVEGDEKRRAAVFRRAVRRQIEGSDYDLIHVRDAVGGAVVCELEPYHGASIVYELGPEDPAGDLTGLQRACIERADLVLVRGRGAAELVAREIPEARTAMLPPGVDIDTFDWEPAKPSRPPRVVYAGAVAEGLGLERLIHTLPAVLEHVDVRLVIAGRPVGSAAARLHARANAVGVADHVTLCQAIDHADMPRFLAGAAIGVVPSIRGGVIGGCPNKLLEYAACRVAVVCERSPVVTALFQEGADIELFDDRPASLARALLRLLEDDQRRGRLVASAYERVRSRLSASASRRRLLSAYAGLVPDAKPRAPAPALPEVALEGSGTTTHTHRAGVPLSDTAVDKMPTYDLAMEGAIDAPVVAALPSTGSPELHPREGDA